ncbi:hypothetical protein [Streptomyces sp. NPDC001970]
MIVGVVFFAVAGIGWVVVEVVKQRWLQVIGNLMGLAVVEMTFAAMIFQQVWIAVVAMIVAVAGSGLLWVLMRREARRGMEQQSG